VHLKSLTLKGFKSFASATTLRFEQGITCIVGPNGSGKSNVVDAIAWVLGEQGAKTLRGGKMEDVIFAGTAGRPALGRAEVTLTIDNSDGALPIDYTEVSLTRRMFRSGESEYEINRTACRLLDVQELLSDSGIGREMHVIVGQGQLDSVLQARPEDRRGFIEEAAGVLKHRRRKERAVRKLDAMQLNLNRLTDLTSELHRQLKPLGRQAEVARRAAGVQADLRDARLRLLADDLLHLREALEREVADETAIRERRSVVERELVAAQADETGLEAALASGVAAVDQAQETWYRLAALEERFRGTARLAAERARFLAQDHDSSRPVRDPVALDREAEEAGAAEQELQRSLASDQGRLTAAVQHREQVEGRLTEAEQALVSAARVAADRREGLARLVGEVNALRTRAAAGADEIARLSGSLAEAHMRAEQAREQYDLLQGQVSALDASELGLDKRHEAAAEGLLAAQATVRELAAAERESERQCSAWTARREALALGLSRKDGVGALLAAGTALPGLLGSVASLLTVQPGYEAALAAALGPVADAVAVVAPADALAALDWLKRTDGGRAGMVVAGRLDSEAAPLPQLPASATWAMDLVTAPTSLEPALRRALHRVAVVADAEAAERLVAELVGARAVTAEGDLFGPDWVVGGSASTPSTLEVQAAIDEAQSELDAAQGRCQILSEQLTAARRDVATCEAEVQGALVALHRSDAELASVAERLGQLGNVARSAAAESARLERARVAADQARDRDLVGLAALEERLNAAESAPIDEAGPSTAERDELAAEVIAARQDEMEVRLAVRTVEERVRGLAGRADVLRRAAADERAAQQRAARARQERARGAVVCAAVERGAQVVLARLTMSLDRAAAERDVAQQARVGQEGELLAVRQRARELAAELERLTEVVHRDEVARTEQRLRIEALETLAGQDYGVDVDTLIREYGPAVPISYFGPGPAEGEPEPEPEPYDRVTQEKRVARGERDLALLGRVNPLALEEFNALEERHAFLTRQLEDLRATKRDLLSVVRDVDTRIHDVFAAAFADTAREFNVVFATLFPGGEGRLVLTEPDDLMATGVEVEARPAGKRVKRLSLLSGGERSLAAIALLVAIFRARPSPFYILDEVEAALDDVNLGRLIGLIDQLRVTSQLIVVTHQKRTMEVADALYGASMRGDGITTVISQRLRERATA